MIAKVSRNVDLILNQSDMVVVYRETNKKYTGIYPLQCVQGTQVFVIINDHELQHNLDQVVPRKDYENLINGDSPINILYTSTKQFRSTKPKEKLSKPEIMITEVLHSRDTRNNSKETTNAKRKGIETLVRGGTWKIVLREKFRRARTLSTEGSSWQSRTWIPMNRSLKQDLLLKYIEIVKC